MENDPSRSPWAPAPAVVTVSQLLRSVREALERRFPLSWVRGELSNVSRAPSGHCYFTLKDGSAQVDCVLFRSRAALLGGELRDGMQIEARVLPTLYEPRGRFQLTVDSVRPAGQGPLFERFLRLKAKLEQDGLFDPALKRPLPVHPRCIGVITSLAAAALRDVLTTLRRRNAGLPVIVYPVPVQGEGAAGRIAAMLGRAALRAECEVLLLVRGGGSLEDLWQFNEESVARAIRACSIPVIVGVGHETDFTIADFAADRRAATPTAAAEMCSPASAELRARVAEQARRLSREMRRRLDYASQAVDASTRRLMHPAERLRASQQHVLGLRARLGLAYANRVHRCSAHVERLQASLASLDPTAVLGRGYSITQTAAGAVLRDPAQAQPGDVLTTTLARGRVESVVKKSGLL